MPSLQDKSPENAGLHKHGMFAEEKHAIETLKSEMGHIFLLQDRRNQTRSLYFNQLWNSKDAVIASAMLAFFNASSAMRAVVETAIEGREDAVKIQAVLIGLLAVALVQNARVISEVHVSDRLIDRSKVVDEIIKGLIAERFGSEPQISEGLMPLAKYAQAACNKVFNPSQEPTQPTSSPALSFS